VTFRVDNVVTNCALFNTAQLLIDIFFPQNYTIDDGIIFIVELRLQHQRPLGSVFHLEALTKFDMNRCERIVRSHDKPKPDSDDIMLILSIDLFIFLYDINL